MHKLHIHWYGNAQGVAVGKAIANEGGNIQAEGKIHGPDEGTWTLTSEWYVHLVRIKMALGFDFSLSFPCVCFLREGDA